MVTRKSLWATGLALAATVALGISGCTLAGSGAESSAPTSEAASNAAEQEPTEAVEPVEEDGQAVDETSGAAGSGVPIELPADFPDLGIPFYKGTVLLEAHQSTDPLWVLQYQSDHELSIVNIFFDHALDDSDWNVINRSVEGSTTVSKVKKEGYFLVIAVGPDQVNDRKTNIYYTLRAQ